MRLQALLPIALLCTSAVFAQDPPITLDPEIAAQVDGALYLDGEMIDIARTNLYGATVLKHGSLDPLVNHMKGLLGSTGMNQERQEAARRLTAALQWQLGDLSDALGSIEGIEASRATYNDLITKARLLDALGKNDKAHEAYTLVLERTTDDQQRTNILLRQALLQTPSAEEPSPLASFARQLDPTDSARNQAAIILGLTDRQKDAIELFTPSGEETSLFQQCVRLAEWSLEAGEFERAQEFADKAAKAAKLKRDRRYALTVLVEAARRDKSLQKLTDRLSQTPDLDDETKSVLIDLLRETGQVEKALELFRSRSTGNFSPEMRRELLEMCRESDNEDTLKDAYLRSIQEEPRFIEWREGLCRFYLERNDRDAAKNVWADYGTVTDEFRYLMAAATSMGASGLADEAVALLDAADLTIDQRAQTRMFAFELYNDRGFPKKAKEALEILDREAPPDAQIRGDLADAWARMGDKKRAVKILTDLREARGKRAGSDLPMALAVLLSETGDEESALELWVELWREVKSVPRRRYVEDRIMTVASRLGTLARIAVDLEKRLAEGEATDLESGLLVRIYTKVKDSVSAAEVIDEHMSSAGNAQADVLNEKARIYMTCEDFYNYEKTIRQLVDADPENSADYLRQLAISNLERGQRKEAWEILGRLREQEASSSISDEFEAGVLALAGLRDEAAQAYRKGLVRQPERIDGYLLLSNIQKELNRHSRSAGMFQYLAETAEKDDLFTIAIDGILNMRDGRSNRGAPDRLVRWARRITLERIARRPNKLYLYQLLADLSDEVRDRSGAIRSLQAAVPIAGEQRTPLLRELMDLSKGRNKDRERRMFGRRLLGQGEFVPPQVYMDLGNSFLTAQEVTSASRTFNQASRLPEFAELQPQIAAAFQSAGYPNVALRVYESVMSTTVPDTKLKLTVAELHEQLGHYGIAHGIYDIALDTLIATRPLFTDAEGTNSAAEANPFYYSRNLDDFDQHRHSLLTGLLATFADDDAIDRWLQKQRSALDSDLQLLREDGDREIKNLSQSPRIAARSNLFEQAAYASGRPQVAQDLDLVLLEAFKDDEGLLESHCRTRVQWGLLELATSLIESAPRSEEQKQAMRLLLGTAPLREGSGLQSPSETLRTLLPTMASGDREALQGILLRTDPARTEAAEKQQLLTLAQCAASIDEPDLALGFLRQYLALGLSGKENAYSVVRITLQTSKALLDKERRKSLIQQLVQGIMDDPSKAVAIVRQLPELEKELGEALLEQAQVENLLRKKLEEAQDTSFYQIPPLINLIAKENRAAAVRDTLTHLPKSQHVWLVLNTANLLETKVSEEDETALANALQAGIPEVKDDWQFSQARSLYAGPKENLGLALRLLDILIEVRGNEHGMLATRAQLLKKMGREDDALDAALTSYKELIAGLPSADWQHTNSIEQLRGQFAKDHMAEFRETLNGALAKNPTNTGLIQESLDLHHLAGDDAAYEKELRAAFEASPTSKDLRLQLSRYFMSKQRRNDAIELLNECIAREPKNKIIRAELASLWLGLSNGIKAEEVVKPVLSGIDDPNPDEKAESQKRRPRANIGLVKKAWDAKKYGEAATEFRRLWRSFPDRSRSNRMVFFRQGSVQKWPPDAVERKTTLRRGGLPKLEDDAGQPTEEPPEGKEPEPRDATEVIATKPEGRAELKAWLRTLTATQLDGGTATKILVALIKQDIAEHGIEKTEEALLAKLQSGVASKLDHAALFQFLEMHPNRKTPKIAEIMDSLLRSVPPQQTGQIRRLARLMAALGETEKASRLYLWCARTQRGGLISRPGVITIIGGRVIQRNLGGSATILDEIIETFDGETRLQLVEALLEATRPDESSFYQLDQYYTQVLGVWSRVSEGEDLSDRLKPTLDAIIDVENQKMPTRRSAAQAVPFFVLADDTKSALKALEIAVCSLDAPEGVENWYVDEFTSAPYINWNQVKALFPKAEPDSSAAEFLKETSELLPKWIAEDRIRRQSAYQALALLTLRCHQAGLPGTVEALLPLLKKEVGTDRNQLLWYADVLERIGQQEASHAIELGLLDNSTLIQGRIPEVLDQIAKSDNLDAAISKGLEVAQACHFKPFLEKLTYLLKESGRPDEAAAWEKTMENSAAKVKEVRAHLRDLRRG